MNFRRNTMQRDLVLKAVQILKHHPTADDIYIYVINEYPSISRGTVYRNLNLLVENADIQRVEVPGAADRFDFNLEKHYHLKCECCKRVFDVDMPYQTDLKQKIRNDHGFQINRHDIAFCGICPECNPSIKTISGGMNDEKLKGQQDTSKFTDGIRR